MTRNALKILACISMLIDHTGYILFPDVPELRYIGRLAMPIFAFFIGEGCLYTKDRKKYFLRLFSLGTLCQAVYVTEYLITKNSDPFYLNILLTFSASILLCSAFLNCIEKKDDKNKQTANLIFIFALIVTFVFCRMGEKDIIPFHFDYGLCGILLPLFAETTKEKNRKLIFFTAGLVWCVFSLGYSDPLYIAFALCSLIPLWFYNGKSGKYNLKYGFYLFYPAHLAVLYLISFFTR